MRTVFILFIYLLAVVQLTAQLPDIDPIGIHEKWIFKITQDQAKDLIVNEKPLDVSYLSQFVQHVESAYEQSKVISKGNTGHYLGLSVQEDNFIFEYIPHFAFHAALFNNGSDLIVELANAAGEPLSDAQILIGKSRIKYRKALGYYLRKDNNKHGVMSITYGSETQYIHLDKEIQETQLTRRLRRIGQKKALKIAIAPIRFVVNLPRDVVRSFKHKQLYGSVGTLTAPVGDIVRSLEHRQARGWIRQIRSLFFFRYKSKNDLRYLLLDRPFYNPGDTIHFKGYSQKFARKKNAKKMLATINLSGMSVINIPNIKNPYPGVYHGFFILSDSLNLKQNSHNNIRLSTLNSKYGFHQYFKIEDVKLEREFSFSVSKIKSRHEQFESNKCTLLVEDENGLYIPGAKINVKINPHRVPFLNSSPDSFYIPQLLYEEDVFVNSRLVSITIPDTVFGQPMHYKVTWTLTLPDGRTKQLNSSAAYVIDDTRVIYHRNEGLDSLYIDQRPNPIQQLMTIDLVGVNRVTGRMDYFKTELPATVYVNRGWSQLIAFHEGQETVIPLHSFRAYGVYAYANRIDDSLYVIFTNSGNIPFRYFIYHMNKEVKRGYEKEALRFSMKAQSKLPYFLNVQYVINGKIYDDYFKIVKEDEALDVSTVLPDVVFPGQEVELSIEVTDANHRPVSDADVTLLSNKSAMKHQLNIYQPKKAKSQKQKQKYNGFEFNKSHYSRSQHLTTDILKKIGLDTLLYYQCRLPESGRFEYQIPRVDSSTQMAVYWIEGGMLVYPEVIYIDRRPLYFGFLKNPQDRYSFHVDSGYHHLALRFERKIIEIDSVWISPHVKNIYSFNEDIFENYAEKIRDKFPTIAEKKYLKKYMYFVTPLRPTGVDYVKQNHNIYAINQAIGPLLPGQFKLKTDNTIIELPAEPAYHYFIKEGFQKLISWTPVWRSLTWRHHQKRRIKLDETAIVEREYVRELRNKKRSQFLNVMYNRSALTKNYMDGGRLIVNWTKKKNPSVNMTVLADYNDLSKHTIYDGYRVQFQHLSRGNYLVIYILNDSTIRSSRKLYVIPNGLNYYSSEFTKSVRNFRIDSLSGLHNMNSIIQNKFDKNYAPELMQEINDSLAIWRSGIITGRVMDPFGEPLIGANVIINGTTHGTITDFSGRFEFAVPDRKITLVISYLGFRQKKIKDVGLSHLEIYLEEGILLNEVVVTGLSISRMDRSLGYAVSSHTPGISVRGSRLSGADYSLDAIRVSRRLLRNDGNFDGMDAEQIENVKALHDISAENPSNQTGINSLFDTNDLSKYSGMRNDFRDVAWWIPDGRTDDKGRFTTKITMPSDVAAWSTFAVVAAKGQLGQATRQLKSYKPILAELNLPRFAIQGDQVGLIGNISNYSSTSFSGSTQWNIDHTMTAKTVMTLDRFWKERQVVNVNKNDSLHVVFKLELDSVQYTDGEERHIPIFQQGVENTKGEFISLFRDTIIEITPYHNRNFMTDVSLFNTTNQILNYHVQRITNYKHKCNEQLSSLLI